jgi:hypothetical protein
VQQLQTVPVNTCPTSPSSSPHLCLLALTTGSFSRRIASLATSGRRFPSCSRGGASTTWSVFNPTARTTTSRTTGTPLLLVGSAASARASKRCKLNLQHPISIAQSTLSMPLHFASDARMMCHLLRPMPLTSGWRAARTLVAVPASAAERRARVGGESVGAWHERSPVPSMVARASTVATNTCNRTMVVQSDGV